MLTQPAFIINAPPPRFTINNTGIDTHENEATDIDTSGIHHAR